MNILCYCKIAGDALLNSWKRVRMSVSLFFVDDGNTFCTFLNLFVASGWIDWTWNISKLNLKSQHFYNVSSEPRTQYITFKNFRVNFRSQRINWKISGDCTVYKATLQVDSYHMVWAFSEILMLKSCWIVLFISCIKCR